VNYFVSVQAKEGRKKRKKKKNEKRNKDTEWQRRRKRY
jgi:hypothetical protein